MRNKRGSLPVIVLVALTLVLTISTLFVFYLNAGKASAQISSVSFVEGMYVQEDLAKYYVYVVGKELLQNDSLTKDNFISEFSKIKFEEDYLIALQKIISTGNFTINNNNFELGKELFWLVSADENTVVKYTSRLKVEFVNSGNFDWLGSTSNSNSGILEFKGSGNYEVLSYEECVSGLEQRKKDLEIPDKLCYWEAMTKVYEEKCPNLDRTEIADIFQKKAKYRQLNNSDWPSLKTDGDFCYNITYNCDKWPLNKKSSSAQADVIYGFVDLEDRGSFQVNPFLKFSLPFVQDILLHETLHLIQKDFEDVSVLGGTVNQLPFSNKELDDAFPERIVLFKELNLEKEVLRNLLYSYLGSLYPGEILPESVDQKPLNLWLNSITAPGSFVYPSEKISNENLFYNFVTTNETFLTEMKKLRDLVNSEEYRFYTVGIVSAYYFYTDKLVELDPRLSEVNRWWFDQTAPNCEVLYTSEEFANALEKFLSDSNTAEEYQMSKRQLNDVLEVAEKMGKREEVWNKLIDRGPGLASTDTTKDGTLVA